MAAAIPSKSTSTFCTPKFVFVEEVWTENLHLVLSKFRRFIRQYNVVTIDTEFPGTIHKGSGDKKLYESAFYNYNLMKANVDDLKIIQLGVTLSDSNGNMPEICPGVSFIWEFNFWDFDMDKDPHDPDAIRLLKRQGIDFTKNKEMGINSRYFKTLFLRLLDEVSLEEVTLTWQTFHGGYDFAYLIKILSGEKLPSDLSSFVDQVRHYFGSEVYDLKTITSRYKLYGGLEKLAKALGVQSNASLLTMQAFLEFKQQKCFADEFKATIQPRNFVGYECQLYGLNVTQLP